MKRFNAWIDKSLHDENHIICKLARSLLLMFVVSIFGIPFGLLCPGLGALILTGGLIFMVPIWFNL